MWRPDIVDLNQFYQGHLGQVARRHLTQDIRETWPDLTGQRVLGIGFATPYLRPFMNEAERVAAIMPANQGVRFWPREGPNRVALADELELPLPDQSFDRILVVHALETSESARPMLREIWRVLNAGGSALFITPNRRGLWSRAEATPFGHGHPYSSGQLTRLLQSSMFQPERVRGGLHMPPVPWRPVLRANRLLERMGSRLWPGFSGVIMVEAQKQIYAATPSREKARGRRRRKAAAAVAVPSRRGYSRAGKEEVGGHPCRPAT
ncbi:MAG: class I SAM-dependent methyltransferase [Minwuia sp.]|uniref:class I SAM-dependent methyltransferase n=1 Tax=Minwuia sp. TaxID=2493630 RepID=UPI003A8ADD6E